ncbi:MAG: nuclear transport factor 2 family protein [Chitinophagaceae bacterium]|nr:nuclear transport factor 2 family protein [Chitinophagaceae bacterium]
MKQTHLYFKRVVILVGLLWFTQCKTEAPDQKTSATQIGALLDTLNRTAARADYQNYFNCYAEDAVFMGTDATERWNKKEFMVWAKPYFDRGKAWDFTSLDRRIYFDESSQLAWFDELLKTQMKVCRGSGIVVRENQEWKIKQYVLSMTIPNSISDTVIHAKGSLEDSLIQSLSR